MLFRSTCSWPFSEENPLRVASEALNIHLVSCILYLVIKVSSQCSQPSSSLSSSVQVPPTRIWNERLQNRNSICPWTCQTRATVLPPKWDETYWALTAVRFRTKRTITGQKSADSPHRGRSALLLPWQTAHAPTPWKPIQQEDGRNRCWDCPSRLWKCRQPQNPCTRTVNRTVWTETWWDLRKDLDKRDQNSDSTCRNHFWRVCTQRSQKFLPRSSTTMISVEVRGIQTQESVIPDNDSPLVSKAIPRARSSQNVLDSPRSSSHRGCCILFDTSSTPPLNSVTPTNHISSIRHKIPRIQVPHSSLHSNARSIETAQVVSPEIELGMTLTVQSCASVPAQLLNPTGISSPLDIPEANTLNI